MTTITLEKLEAEHEKFGKLIEQFKLQATTSILMPEANIELRHGEHYAGIIVGKDGQSSHHLILLPGKADRMPWKDAVAWAKKEGGELPTRREQSLLFANLKEEFEEAWYWSGEEHASVASYAWYQGFANGSQNFYDKDGFNRARAVRRLVIE